MSTSTVAYVRPLRSEKSSAPSTRTAPAGGSGTAISTRISVSRLTSAASTVRASRDPARPASAAATAPSCPASSGVFRAYGVASPAGCSAKLPFGQSGLPHRSSRTTSQISTRRPPAAVSRSRREYLPRTFVHQVPQPGHAAPSAAARTQMLTRSPLMTARSTAVTARYGSSSASTPASCADKETLTCDTDITGLPGSDDSIPPAYQVPATKTTHRKPRKNSQARSPRTLQPHNRYPAAVIQKYATEPGRWPGSPTAR